MRIHIGRGSFSNLMSSPIQVSRAALDAAAAEIKRDRDKPIELKPDFGDPVPPWLADIMNKKADR